MNTTLLNSICALPAVAKLLRERETAEYPQALTGIPVDVQGVLIAAIASAMSKRALIIAPDESAAEKVLDVLRGLLGESAAAFLPARELVFDAVDAAAAENIYKRICVLRRALRGELSALVTTADGAAALCPDPEKLGQTELILHPGDRLDMSRLIDFLQQNGYTRLEVVEGVGSYAVRGSIVDVFSPDDAQPVRIDFFDDEIDLLGHFDTVSQRRTDAPPQVTLGPAKVISPTQALAEQLSALRKKIKDEPTKRALDADIEALENNLLVAGADRYLPLMQHHALWSYMPDAVLFVCDYGSMRSRFEFMDWQICEDIKRCVEQHRPILHDQSYFFGKEALDEKIRDSRAVLLSLLPSYNEKLSLLEDLSVREDVLTRNDRSIMFSEIRQALTAGQRVLWCVGSQTEHYRKLLEEESISHATEGDSGVCLLPISLRADVLFDGKLMLLGDAVQKKARRTHRRAAGEKIRSFADIQPGDLVVHVHHGIGVYRGIRRVDNHGVIKDYLTISYDQGDTLYVPTPQLDLISKYVGTAEDSKVKLSRLGSAAWEKQKAKAKKEASLLAKELILLYARRQKATGFAFSKDTDWQMQFEENFPYEETEDQLRCIAEIKEDMEKPVPMDRLLCGDVGFGKTEVALRAVFKAVSDSKQAAILAPTTILSDQHLATIRERFRGFPIKAEVLNRFKTPKQQAEILRRLRRGEIDIIVGTHRLLQKDVVFKDLGLLVVDEEQRFGVKHKEAIKQMSVGVDVLTLSATPIPRTLNMALSGIRDMSIIEEAPADRHPVATYVLEYDQAVVMGAIRREMRRHGCVYYLKNDIEALDGIAARISREIPGVRIALAHGRMAGRELERIWESVLAREVDVLLCTTIIETGIDMPFTNTLIVENADRFGLAGLHQLRGRIGRSNIRAYAYLTYQAGKVPSEVAAKRLMTIREFTEFGSGFKIAMRDLEIRGAGSVLGERQHGHINTIGYDLYMKILSEAIAGEKGTVQKVKSDCTVDIAVSAYLPAEYVSHEESRVDLYKKIAAIENDEDMADVTDELCDRFGEPPQTTINLMRIAKLRGMARLCGVDEIKQKGEAVLLYMKDGDPDHLIGAIKAFRGRLLLSDGARPYFTLRLQPQEDVIEALQALIDYLNAPEKA